MEGASDLVSQRAVGQGSAGHRAQGSEVVPHQSKLQVRREGLSGEYGIALGEKAF